jgi:hypothetical protein
VSIEIFFSYAHEDEELVNDVRQQLVIFERQGKIIKWHDRQIPAGTEWKSVIDHRLQHCHMILLFVSPDFLESRYCWDVEVKVALERHERGDARVIPIILRPCPWEVAPFAKLQALPRDGRPLSQWADRDQACLDIARGLMAVVDELRGETGAGPPPPLRPSEIAPKRRERRLFEGDKIPRLLAPFKPPTGINIPPGYQRRLNYIAAEVRREFAARSEDGGYEYPVHVRGTSGAVHAFTQRAATLGKLSDLGIENGSEQSEGWFEYRGDVPPRQLGDLAAQSGLRVVQCGATLIT